ncbi:MAG: hypothetical protein NDI94_01920 [Candidatus Woesearchaeota archaeon]|nr:hypothetical protein [Candidatus Woesearchaeota archaeon]
MEYYSNSCSAGRTNYSVSMPSVNYSMGSSNSVNYSMNVDSPVYHASGNYAVNSSSNVPAVIDRHERSDAAIVPKNTQLLPSNDSFNNVGFDRPIDRIIEDFLPKRHSNPAIDEIERAIGNVIRMEQFEIEEEIIIRRRIKKTSVTATKKEFDY